MARTPEDEWFPHVDKSNPPGEPDAPIVDEWLAGDDDPPRPAPFDPSSLANRRVLVPTGLALVFLVALLAAVGVFSSGAPPIPAAARTLSAATPSIAPTTTATPPRSTPAPPTTTLKPGDSGPQVKALQQELSSLGYSVGAIDSNYGPATIKAVTAFQRADHLTPDGVVGPSTLLALAP
jgi:peptidoglycan hydrolase-like protein with peptidoglycan-binding domain